MTELLTKAFKKASRLPIADQDAFAEWILDELESESKWDKLFSDSADILEKLADEALKEDEEGKTKSLKINSL